jgi:hypothetical protein
MLDTLKLTIPQEAYHVRRENGLTVQKLFFQNEQTDRRGLFPYSDGSVEDGSGAWLNTPQFNFDIKRYGKRVVTQVQFSAPKVVDGQNYEPANLRTTERALELVQEGLDRAGVVCDLWSSRLARVDVTRNALTEHPVPEYAPVFEMLRGGRLKDRVTYPSGFLLKNGVREVCVYDKRLEMSGRGLDVSNVPANVLRAEVRAVDGRTARRGLELETAADLVKHFDRVPEMHLTVMRSLFKHDGCKVQEELQTEAARIFAAERARGRANWIVRSVSICGASHLCGLLGEDGLRRVLYTVGLTKQGVYRSMEKILELRDSGLEQRETLFNSRVAVGALYDELKMKLAA